MHRAADKRHVRASRRRAMWPSAAILLAGCVAATVVAPSASLGAGSSASSRGKRAGSAVVKKVRVAKPSIPAMRIGSLPSMPLAGLPADLACVASFQFDFSPKLNGGKSVSSQTTAALTNCFSPNGTRPDVRSSVLFADRGHSTATGCAPLPIAIDGVGTLLWNDGSSSDFFFRVNTNPLAKAFGLAAHVTSGYFSGETITAAPLLILQDGVCGVNGGVNSLSVTLGVDIITH